MNLRGTWQNSLRILGHLVLANVATLLCKSLKVRIFNEDSVKKLKQENKNYIVAFWHGTMLYPWYLHGNPSFAALTSKSRDGELLAPIVLTGIGYKNKKILSTWDKFEIPYFFSSANIYYSKPVYVSEDLSYEETSEKIIECENKLNELQKQAQEFD
ncbi:MAG: hypothetical protein P8Y81_06580 [Ignavibacteriaceae bacterium]